MSTRIEHQGLVVQRVSRRTFLRLAVAGLLAGCKPAQRPAPEPTWPPSAVPTSAPAEPAPATDRPRLLAHLHWLGHASFRLDGPPTIYFDPTTATSDSPLADIILISHDHSDHYAPAALKHISSPETVIITIPGIAQMLEGEEGVYGEIHAIQPGERVVVGDVVIEGMPAYNVNKGYHPKEAGYLGFIVTFAGERLYFAGDTDHIPEMAEVECDVALLPIGGTYTMDVEEAAQAAAEIGAQVTVPMHTRSADPEEFRARCACEVVIMGIEF